MLVVVVVWFYHFMHQIKICHNIRFFIHILLHYLSLHIEVFRIMRQ